MPKGKVAVIETCRKCPHVAFDSVFGYNPSEIAYCGWFKPLDNSKIRLVEYLEFGNPKYGQPDNCPLPDGCDNSKWRNITGEDSGKYPNSTDF